MLTSGVISFICFIFASSLSLINLNGSFSNSANLSRPFWDSVSCRGSIEACWRTVLLVMGLGKMP